MIGTTMGPISTRKPPISMTARLSANQPIPLEFSGNKTKKKAKKEEPQVEPSDSFDAALKESESKGSLDKERPDSLLEAGDEDVESLGEPLDEVDFPSSDEYAAYNAKRKEQQLLQWGKQFEAPARALGWANTKVKNNTRWISSSAKELCDLAAQTAANAVQGTRRSAAGLLKRAAVALEGEVEPTPAVAQTETKK